MRILPAAARDATARERTTCVLGLALGIAGFAFIGIEHESVAAQMAGNPLWWLVPAVLIVPGMYGVMIVAALRWSARAVRAVCGVFPWVYLPVVLTIPLAFEYRALPPVHGPWPILVGSGTIITASFVLPMRAIAVLALFYAGVHAVATHWSQHGVTPAWAVREGLSIAMIGVIFAAVVRSVERNSRTIDRETQALREAALARARAAAIVQERERVDALVHDTVVSTFVAANTRAPLSALRESAARSLEVLDQLGQDDEEDRCVDAREFAARLRQAATDVSDTITAVDHDDSGGATYPLEVARLFQEVVAEAARNSVRHAGPGARRLVNTELYPDMVLATFTDDGAGFDPAAVPPNRLGIKTGMRTRVAHVPGAGLAVDSAPGRGTRITVRWRRGG